MMKALVKITATIEAEEWMDVDENLDSNDLMHSVEEFGNDVVATYFNAGYGDYNFEILEVDYGYRNDSDDVNPDDEEGDYDEDYSSFADPDDEDEDEDDYGYESTDPDSIGTRIN